MEKCNICGNTKVEVDGGSYACPLCNPIPVFQKLGKMIEEIAQAVGKVEKWIGSALESDDIEVKDMYLKQMGVELGVIEEEKEPHEIH